MENLILIVAIVLLVTMERIPSVRFTPSRFFRPFFTTDVVYFLTGALGLGFVLRAQASHWAGTMGLMGVPALEPGVIPFLALVLLATVLYDLGAYMSHVLLHNIDALWELHKVHHSSRTLDWLATFRGHLLEHLLRHLASPVLLLLLGFPIKAVGISAALYGAWAAFGHANVHVPVRFLEPVFITPRLHRLHHVPGTAAYNLGTIFSVWDRIRGSLVTDPSARLEPIGVPGEMTGYPQSWLPQLIEPLRRIRRANRSDVDREMHPGDPQLP